MKVELGAAAGVELELALATPRRKYVGNCRVKTMDRLPGANALDQLLPKKKQQVRLKTVKDVMDCPNRGS